MSGFQQSALLNFFNESNTALVQALADKYGFDMAEAMSHIQGLDSSSVLTKAKKTKKTKDPNAPKRSPSAFFLFSKQFRMDHADEITGMRAPDVAKMAGAAWNDAKTSGAAESFHTEAAELKAAAGAQSSSPEPIADNVAIAQDSEKAPKKKAMKKKAMKKDVNITQPPALSGNESD